jgi:hypothetical protein
MWLFKNAAQFIHNMKHSDSKNSLAELNPDDHPCFICLESENELAEPLVDSVQLRNCGCKFKVHPFCWNQWMKDKTSYDCPICRKESLNNPQHPSPLDEFLASQPFRLSSCNGFFWYCIFMIISAICVALYIVYGK